METEEELSYRRSLMKAAANGDVLAQQKLKEEYEVWIFSPSEREQSNRNREASRLPADTSESPAKGDIRIDHA